jgi:hypothetical protein
MTNARQEPSALTRHVLELADMGAAQGSFETVLPRALAAATEAVAASRGEPPPIAARTLRDSVPGAGLEAGPFERLVAGWIATHGESEVLASYVDELVTVAAKRAGRGAGDLVTSDPLIDVMTLAARSGFDRDDSLPPQDILDLTCGTGRLLLRLASRLGASAVAGQDVNVTSAAIAACDLYLRGAVGKIRVADTLTSDAFPDQQFGLAIADVPFMLRWEQQQSSVRAEAASS